MENEKTWSLTTHCEKNKSHSLGSLIKEKAKQARNKPFYKVLTNMYDKIRLNTNVRKDDTIITSTGHEIKFTQVTQKQLYEEALTHIGSSVGRSLECSA